MKIFILTLIAAFILFNQTGYSQIIDEPECVTYNETHQTYIVSCWGNGKILKIGTDGIINEFIDVGSHALGHVSYQDTIYVSIGTTVKGYDFFTGNEVFSLSIPEAHQLDGMCFDNAGNLYVADYHYQGSNDYIIKIIPSENSYEIFAEENLEESPQDIIFDEANNRLIVASYGDNTKIQAVDINTGEVSDLVTNSIGNFDGIAMDSEGNHYFSSWETNAIHKYNPDFTGTAVTIISGYDGPANLCYNPDKNELAVPVFNENRIDFIKLINFEEITIEESIGGPACLFLKDIDNDGNSDIICAGSNDDEIAVLFNDGNDPIAWTKQVVDDNFANPLTVFAADIDNDGNTDIISGSWSTTGELAWWENDGSETIEWTKHTIETVTPRIHEIFVYDINQDGHPDILGAGAQTNEIIYWENDGTNNFTRITIADDFMGARSVFVSDFDRDGDPDIVGAALDSDDIRWWRNDGGTTIVWTEFIITDEFNMAHRVEAYDFDHDGDDDILGTAYSGEVAWWINNGGNPVVWSKQTVDNTFQGSVIACAADFDFDGDMDVSGTSQPTNDVVWWRNNGTTQAVYTKQNLNQDFDAVWPMVVGDIDNDGDIDIVAGGNNANRIKWWKNDLFSSPDHAPVASMTVDFPDVCLNSQATFTDFSYGNIDTYEWNFGENANPQTANTQGPHIVAFDTEGEQTVTLSVGNTYGTNTKTITVNVITDLVIEVSSDEVTICNSEEAILMVSGAGDFTWSPATGLSNTSGSAVIASPSENITYTIEGSQGTCTGSATIDVVIAESENDFACSAIDLNIGSPNGPFSNRCGTPEENEPVPPLTGCTGQMSWCDEGGVQNSMWFTFTAPESGRISLEVTGFDTQVALYDADDCNLLYTGSYELLAANDDQTATNPAPKLSDVNGLTPGKTYYVQVDGSAGGVTGDFTITITDLDPQGVEEKKTNKVSIYPNPSTDYIMIETDGLKNGTIELFSLTGAKVYSTEIVNDFQRIDLTGLSTGIYGITVKNEKLIYNSKVIKE